MLKSRSRARLFASAAAVVILAAAGGSASSAHAAAPTIFAESGLGADAWWTTVPQSGSPVPGVIYTQTTVNAASQITTDSAGGYVQLYYEQDAFTYDANGNQLPVSVASGSASEPDVQFNISRKLDSASVSANIDLTTCDANWNCQDAGVVPLNVSWTRSGTVTRSFGHLHAGFVGGNNLLGGLGLSASADATGSVQGSSLGTSLYGDLFSGTTTSKMVFNRQCCVSVPGSLDGSTGGTEYGLSAEWGNLPAGNVGQPNTTYVDTQMQTSPDESLADGSYDLVVQTSTYQSDADGNLNWVSTREAIASPGTAHVTIDPLLRSGSASASGMIEWTCSYTLGCTPRTSTGSFSGTWTDNHQILSKNNGTSHIFTDGQHQLQIVSSIYEGANANATWDGLFLGPATIAALASATLTVKTTCQAAC
jgi:hypothetical protein